MVAATTSFRLWGTSVAMPTAMPAVRSAVSGPRATRYSRGCHQIRLPVHRALTQLNRTPQRKGSRATRCSAWRRRIWGHRRAPVTLTIDQWIAVGEVLCHQHHCFICRTVAGRNLPITSPTVRADFLYLADAFSPAHSWRKRCAVGPVSASGWGSAWSRITHIE